MSQQRFEPILKNLPLVHQGKTRDTHETLDLNNLLIVATQRLSTHNVIIPTERTDRAQELHLCIEHIICDMIDRTL